MELLTHIISLYSAVYALFVSCYLHFHSCFSFFFIFIAVPAPTPPAPPPALPAALAPLAVARFNAFFLPCPLPVRGFGGRGRGGQPLLAVRFCQLSGACTASSAFSSSLLLLSICCSIPCSKRVFEACEIFIHKCIELATQHSRGGS